MGVDLAPVCEKVGAIDLTATRPISDQYFNSRANWNWASEQADCTTTSYDFQAAQKTFCDLHCIVDAVEKGNRAMLTSMKGLEGHLVNTVYDMLQFYATEMFERLKETGTDQSQ